MAGTAMARLCLRLRRAPATTVLRICHCDRDRRPSRCKSFASLPAHPPTGSGRYGCGLPRRADRGGQPSGGAQGPEPRGVCLFLLLVTCHSPLVTAFDDPDFLLRFQNEAASTGRIHHANVVTIYESGQADDGTPYVAMEFLEGESLRQALARRGALPVPEVAEILQQAARGLNAAHKLGIIHRDLKPDNIFLTYPDDESVARV